MKISDLYATYNTVDEIAYTGSIPTLDYTDPETALAPYYMGYVPWDEVSRFYKMSRYRRVQDGFTDYTEFVNVTATENVPWFLTGRYGASVQEHNSDVVYLVNDTTNKYEIAYVTGTSPFHEHCLFNALEVQRVANTRTFNISVIGNQVNTLTTPPTYNFFRSRVFCVDGMHSEGGIGVDELAKFIKGEKTFEFTVANETFTLTYDDLKTGYCTKESTQITGFYEVFLCEFTPVDTRRVYNPGNVVGMYNSPSSMLKLHANINGEIKPYLSNSSVWKSASTSYVEIFNGVNLGSYVHGYGDHYLMGGFTGRIPFTFFSTATLNRVYHLEGCNFILARVSNSKTRIEPIISIDDLYHFLSWQTLRNTEDGGYGFGDNILYPLFNSDNSPKWEFASGSLTDIQTLLQPWQYTNITTNTFTESDVPPYSEDGNRQADDSQKFSGAVPIPLQPRIPGFFGFITQYVMNSYLIADFASRFWARFITWDGTQVQWNLQNLDNFFIALGNTGTLDFSKLLEYIVSVQVFPFDIPTMCADSSFTPALNQVCIGSGVLPIPLDSTHGVVKTINQMAVQFGGQSYQFVPQFDDYRDFTATSIELYIPFCGSVDINPNDAFDIVNGHTVGNTIEIYYSIDMQTGHMTTQVVLRVDSSGYTAPLVTLEGKCSVQIPLSAGNVGQMVAQMVRSLANDFITVSSIEPDFKKEAEKPSEKALPSNGVEKEESISTPVENRISFIKPQPFRAYRKNASPFADMFMQVRNPYVTYRTGRYHTPSNYPHTFGKQFLYKTVIGNQSANNFIKCINVDCSGITATAEERSMIKALLESGVYL